MPEPVEHMETDENHAISGNDSRFVESYWETSYKDSLMSAVETAQVLNFK